MTRQRPARQWRSSVMAFPGNVPFGDPLSALNVPSARASTVSISYSPSTLALTVGVPMAPAVPTVIGPQPRLWQVLPVLPAGIVMAWNTGVISGTPTTPQGNTAYTVTALSGEEPRTTTITIGIT